MNSKTRLFRQFLLIFSVVTMLSACSDGLSKERHAVRAAAERCYGYLQKGECEKFVGEIAYADSMPEAYREQMVVLLQEFVANQQAQHGGWAFVRAVGDTIVADQAHVSLQICFADSTLEEVGLPMVKVGKHWKMQ